MALPTNLQNKIAQSSQRTLNQKIIISSYGDGMEQTASIGINNRYDEWVINWEKLTLTERNDFMSFFSTVGLVQSFDFTPPNGTLSKWRIVEPPTENNSGWFYDISIKIKQVFQ